MCGFGRRYPWLCFVFVKEQAAIALALWYMAAGSCASTAPLIRSCRFCNPEDMCSHSIACYDVQALGNYRSCFMMNGKRYCH